MIDPYSFVRIVTIGLGSVWTTTGLLRALDATRRWKERLSPLALDDRWWRRRMITALLRVTVLDPINLALLCVLVGVWSRRLWS